MVSWSTALVVTPPLPSSAVAVTFVRPAARNWCTTVVPVAEADPSPKFHVTVLVSVSVTAALSVTRWYFVGLPLGESLVTTTTGAVFASTFMVRSAILMPLVRPSSAVSFTE